MASIDSKRLEKDAFVGSWMKCLVIDWNFGDWKIIPNTEGFNVFVGTCSPFGKPPAQTVTYQLIFII